MTIAVPFNDAEAMERRIERLIEEGRAPACVIMEAAMMNLGVVLPEPGYLEAVREITRKHGIMLIFDEVKTGLCIAAGGAVERFGVMPDLVTLAKALGGGLPSGAIGGTDEAFELVEAGKVVQVGTYNGNPLSMAAARANLLEVMTPEAYAHLDALNEHLLAGCQAVIEKYSFPGYSVGVGSKGCVTFSPEKITDYESFKANQDAELCELAWLYNMNRGIFMTPGPRGGVDAVDHAHLRRLRPLRRRVRGAGGRPDRVAAGGDQAAGVELPRSPRRSTGRAPTGRPPRHAPRRGTARGRRSRPASRRRGRATPRHPGTRSCRSRPRARRACRRRARSPRRCSARRRGSLPPPDPRSSAASAAAPASTMAGERLGPLGVAAGQPPEARRADIRLEQVLLEEHPGVDVRALDAVVRQERRALGEVEQDRAGLGDRAPSSVSSIGVPPGRVAREVLVGLRLAREDVDRDALVRAASSCESSIRTLKQLAEAA